MCNDRGVTILPKTTAKQIEPVDHDLHLTLAGDSSETISADIVLCAMGRKPNLKNIGLERAGVELKEGAIAVDSDGRPTQLHIFAVGECINRVLLTPVARAEGRTFADAVFSDRATTVNYDFIPSAVFSRPEAATVGMTEAQVRKTFGDDAYCCRREFEPLFHTLSKNSEQMLIKLVINRSSDKVLGFHIVGESAAEIVQSLTPQFNRESPNKPCNTPLVFIRLLRKSFLQWDNAIKAAIACCVDSTHASNNHHLILFPQQGNC